jgi:hypothetical protein
LNNVGATRDSDELCELLDDELAFDATTTTHLSNHLPMALVALDRLGANPERLREFAARYQSRLVPVELHEGIETFEQWRAAIGRRGTYGAMRTYFERATSDDGTEEVLRRHLPALVDGLGGAAFHGVIRLAYALETQSLRRIAAGLAYTSAVHQPLGERGRAAPITSDPAEALRKVASLRDLATTPRSGNIAESMSSVAAHEQFDGVVDWLEVGPDTPSRLTAAAVALYATTDDFTALHGVTGSHAISTLAPYVDDTDALVSHWFQALAAAYVTIGAPPLDEPTAAVEPWLAAPASWVTVSAAAINSTDEHVIKLVYTARELDGRSSDPLLLACAARQAGVAPEP